MPQDLSHACWRCAHWAGFAEAGANHSRCSRLNASPLQASSATGCASWTAGVGDCLPPGWAPVGFSLERHNGIWGKPSAEDARLPAPRDECPHLPCDQIEFDQKADATAWRLTGELLNRARLGSC